MSTTTVADSQRAPAPRAQARTGPIPLSSAQQRLWFLDRLKPGSTAYSIPLATRLTGPLEVRTLERALGEVLRRHESLRTTFDVRDGEVVQVLHPPSKVSIPVEDLTSLATQARERAAAARVEDEERKPFDLVTGPLVRARLLRLWPEEHILLLTLHHIVSDGWSVGVLGRELSLLYHAYRHGQSSPLPALSLQYADYVLWQRGHLAGDALAEQTAYWTTQLSGAPALLALPTDHPRPVVQSDRGAGQSVVVSCETLDGLRALARREGATLYMVLLAAFQVLLGKYSGQTDIVVGTPVAGRTREELEPLIGLFVNTLALRTDLSGDPTFRELLRQVRGTTLAAYQHQALPFERLVEALAPERSLAHSPVFQVMLALQNMPRHTGATPAVPDGPHASGGTGGNLQLDLVMRAFENACARADQTAKYDLTLHALESAEGLRLALVYRTDLFEKPSMMRLLERFERVLAQVISAPERRLSALDLLDSPERQQVLVEWNATAADIPRDICLHELFEAQVVRTPDAVAVVAGNAQLTYAALNARASQLAHYLRRQGVGPEVRVAVCLERGPELLAALLGVLKAGGAYVPLDPTHPAERLAAIVADSDATLVLTCGDAAPNRLGMPQVIGLDAIAATLARESTDTPVSGVRAEQLAYVIYTSGSTGRPKGVLGTHGQVTHYLAAVSERYGLGDCASVLQVPSVAGDACLREIFGGFRVGARLVLLPATGAADAAVLLDYVTAHQVQGIWAIVPSFLQELVRAARERCVECPSVATLLVAGEAFPQVLAAQARTIFPNARLINQYGPTEGTITATSFEVVPGAADDGVLPLGRPLPNARVYVLDANLQPVPAGLVGEAHLAGVGITRGYVKQAGLTAVRFVPDPFSSDPGARLYRTGDRVRWRADGQLEFLGRLDSQIKLRGFRIEPDEIESVLRAAPGVAQAAVVVREDCGEPRLVAYVSADLDVCLSVRLLREHLQARLPGYMMPSAVVVVEGLPRLPNGKLDRRRLPAPEHLEEMEYLAPRTPAEELLAGIWTALLLVEQVGVYENFFALGGHSLTAARVMSRVRDVFGTDLPLQAIFEAPTVAELAMRIDGARVNGTGSFPPIPVASRSERLPLSFAQQRLWFVDQLEPGKSTYNIGRTVRLAGDLDINAMARALGEIVRRHEALRTTFEGRDGVATQVIHPPAGAFALPVEDLANLPTDARERVVVARAEEEARAPFDLSTGPLLRGTVLRLGPAEHLLILTTHHIVSDDWSLGVLFRELSAIYTAFVQNASSPLPELRVQYADYMVWQRERLVGEALTLQLSYWTTRLAGAPALLTVPTDFPRPAAQSDRGARQSVVLPRERLDELRALAQREGVTLYMVLLAAFQALLGRYSGQTDVVVGSTIAGRTREELEALIGVFVNTLLLRADLSQDPSFRDLLAQARETTLGAYEHQALPFERLVEELAPERSLAYSPLFQVLFVLHNAPRHEEAEMAGIRVRLDAPLPTHTTKYDLVLHAIEQAEGLQLVLTYRTDLFKPGTMARLLAHFEHLLAQVSAAPERRLSEIEWLQIAERQQVLVEWNATASDLPREGTLPELFQAQVTRTPDAVAVVSGSAQLTYAALNARANQLAHYLRREGVGAEVRVAVCLERSPELLVALLAILKAGGAYVPLDSVHPPDRLAHMLQNSGARLLLTCSAMMDVIPEASRVILLDEICGEVEREPEATAPAGRVRPDDLAYVVYTSGSTGRPKGVLGTHGQVTHYLAAIVESYGLRGCRSVLQLATVAADAALREVFGAFSVGARLVLMPTAGAVDPRALLDHITAERIHGIWSIVPSFLQALLRAAAERGTRCPSVGALLVVGEAFMGTLAGQARSVFTRARFINQYGPTECTMTSTYFELSPDAEARGILPLGRPLPNVRVYVLDPNLRPAPVGLVGEAYLGGAGVTRGYAGQPAHTAERFLPDQFSNTPGARLYRTGDRVRWLANGTLEFLGRLDHQIKLRGFRVEPGEIETVLRQCPGVRGTAVVLREDDGEKRLVAYVTSAEGAEPTGAGLRRWLEERLPEYMVPSAFVLLDAFPLLPNGKLDRSALPSPVYVSENFTAPRTETEERLAGIWTELLPVEHVGVHDDFFALGGHSLIATQVESRVLEVFGVELPLGALFEGPTVAEMAESVDELLRTAPSVAVAIERVPRGESTPIPLTFAQQRLWFLDRLEPGNRAYIISMAARLPGRLSVPALERAFGDVIQRHEVLRTTFVEDRGEPAQVIGRFTGFVLPLMDLSQLTKSDRDRELLQLVDQEGARPFDLRAGPLLRGRLLRLSAEEHVLLVSMHHIVSDGWSLGVFVNELRLIYGAYTEDRTSPLSELPVQYADFAVWQRQQLQPERLKTSRAYWRQQLAGAPFVLDLPSDYPRPAVQSYRGAQRRLRIPEDLAHALRSLAQREGATLYMVLLAACQLLLAKYSGQKDLIVGCPIAGRTRQEVEGLIGLFVNTLALRADLAEDQSFHELLASVRRTTTAAYEHQELPFEQLVEALDVEFTLSHHPVFQVVVVHQAAAEVAPRQPALALEPMAIGRNTAKFDLEFAWRERRDGLECVLEYATDLFAKATIERLAAHLCTLLEQIASNPNARLAELSMLTADERQKLLQAHNHTALELPAEPIHVQFERQVALTPDAVAVSCEGETLTYAELNARANRVAHTLAEQGVKPEVVVGILAQRSMAYWVAVLGVFKAGGALLPLDPGHPAQRQRQVLTQSGAALVLVDDALDLDLVDDESAGTNLPRALSLARVLASRHEDGNLAVPVEDRHLAYVIFTSGSTGVPKGAMIEHGGLRNHLWMKILDLEIDADDSVAQTASQCFDISIWQFFSVLLRGGRVEVLEDAVVHVPALLVRALDQRGITIVQTVPSLMQLWVEALRAERLPLSRLRWLVPNGEVLPPELCREWLELYPHVPLVNAYGLTETSDDVLHERVVSAPGAEVRQIALGELLPNARVYVLDDQLEPTPPGVAGELYVGGVAVGRGYVGQGALTAQRFVPDPFSAEPGLRLYRTGDRVRWGSAGTLEFLGRVDHQIKLRGFRIEIGEIEAALRLHPWVREAVVLVREDAPGGARLLAYVVGATDLTAAQLQQHLKERLPEYMVPSAIVLLDAMPLNTNGKLDRHELPAPEGGSEKDYVAPRDLSEELVAGIWADVLPVTQVGVHDNFFALGGHSLVAMRVVSRVREVFEIELPLRTVFEHPTVADLAAVINARLVEEQPVS